MSHIYVLALALLAAPLLTADGGYRFALTCAPPQARVYIDGDAVGQAPFSLEPAPGVYALEVAKDGFKTFKKTIAIGGNKDLFIRLISTASRFTFIEQVKTGPQPKDVLFSPDDRYLMVTLLVGRGLNVYDMRSNELALVPFPAEYRRHRGLVEGVFSPGGKEFWATQMAGLIYVLNVESLTFSHVIETGGTWTKVGEFSPDGRLYCASNWSSNDITVFDTRTYSAVRKFGCPGAREPRGLGFSQDGRYFYVVLFESGHVMKFSVHDDFKLISRVRTGGTNGRFRADYTKGVAYTNNMLYNCFFVFDLRTEKVRKRVPTGENPNNLKLSPDKRYVCIANRGPNHPENWLLRSPLDGTIQVFDSEQDFALVDEIAVGNKPIGISITSDNRILAISNFQDDNIEFYSIAP